jgi:hypothetical protein
MFSQKAVAAPRFCLSVQNWPLALLTFKNYTGNNFQQKFKTKLKKVKNERPKTKMK